MTESKANDPLAPMPLSDTELDQLLKNGKAVPPPEFSERFWQDLEPKLDQSPMRNPRLWMRPSLIAAAAGLVVMLLAFPVAMKMGQQNEDTASLAELNQQPPATYGAAVPEHKEARQVPATDSNNADKPSSPAPEKLKQEAATAPAAPRNQGYNRQRPTQTRQPQRQSTSTQPLKKTADMTPQIAAMLEPMKGQVHKLEQDRYELKVPANQSTELKTRLKDWEIPHTLLERGMHEKGQVIYRLELK